MVRVRRAESRWKRDLGGREKGQSAEALRLWVPCGPLEPPEVQFLLPSSLQFKFSVQVMVIFYFKIPAGHTLQFFLSILFKDTSFLYVVLTFTSFLH